MKKTALVIISIIMLFQLFIPVSAETEAVVIYVSPNGSDNGDGSWSNPYLTLQAAVTKSRSYTGEKRIRMRGGIYKATAQVSLNSKDNGLVIENAYGEKPEITGGDYIPYSALKKCTDPVVIERLIESSAKENLMYVYLPDVGITEYGKLARAGHDTTTLTYAPTLTFKDKYLTLGEYPNKGYLYTNQILSDENSKNIMFNITNTRYKKWADAKDLWVLGYFKHDWADVIEPATFDIETGIFSSYSNHKASPNRRVRFFNLLEEIDLPGEYYIDRETGYLYIYPPQEMTAGDNLVFSSFGSRFILISSAKNVTIQGIKFSGTTKTGIYISSGSDNKINACEITATGDYAIYISNCTNAVVSNCNIHDVGGGGVYAQAGNRNNLTPGNIIVENSRFERFMQYRRTYMPAVYMNGVGQRVSNCTFADAPHEAIYYKGNNHIIEYCDISNVCNDSADCGSIYTGRDWSTQGNHIRYNYFHDMRLINTTTGMKNHAVYLDDTHSSTRVYGNIFYKVSSVALYGGGRYNTFVNNLMLECEQPFYFDNRGMTWTTTAWLSPENSSSCFNLLKKFDYKNGVWAEQYPYLANILEDEPLIPKHNVITGNVIYKSPGYSFAKEVYDYGTVKNNITINNTKSFANYKEGNFSILPGSEILKSIPDFKVADLGFVGVKTHTLNNRSSAPTVNNITISGTSLLSASYDFLGKGYYEGTKTKTEWLYSDTLEGPYTAISTSKNLSVTDEITGKYIKARITPANCEGVYGTSVLSAAVIAGRPTNTEILNVTNKDEVYTFVNKWSKPLTLGIFSPEYKEINGIKEMTGLKTSFVTIGDTTDVEVKETDIIVTTDNMEPAR